MFCKRTAVIRINVYLVHCIIKLYLIIKTFTQLSENVTDSPTTVTNVDWHSHHLPTLTIPLLSPTFTNNPTTDTNFYQQSHHWHQLWWLHHCHQAWLNIPILLSFTDNPLLLPTFTDNSITLTRFYWQSTTVANCYWQFHHSHLLWLTIPPLSPTFTDNPNSVTSFEQQSITVDSATNKIFTNVTNFY